MQLQWCFYVLLVTSVSALLVKLDVSSLLKQESNDPSVFLELFKTSPAMAFELWTSTYNKSYGTDQEHSHRISVWEANLKFISSYNTDHSSHKLAVNEFADQTWAEFSGHRLGLRPDPVARALRQTPFRYGKLNERDLPERVDWREEGVVTPVKNQGQCGSCWAFSTTGAIEGVNALNTGDLVALSEQELVDCDKEQDMGCGGGLMDNAFEFVVKNGGIDTEHDYGYYSSIGMGLWCNRRKEHDRTVVSIDGFEDVPHNDEAGLKKAAANQPIAVGICASPALQFYHKGVIDTCCDSLNHGVLVVGYDSTEDGIPYWTVKNSWGRGWGDEGYFKLKYGVGDGGLCGIATTASYPVKDHPNEPVPEVCDPFAWKECAVGSSCCCSFSFFNLFCLVHDCCPHANGACCSDNAHCCPSDLPVCNVQAGTCSSKDGSVSQPWTEKVQQQQRRGEVGQADDVDLARF